MNDARRSLLKSILAAPAAGLVSEPQVVESPESGKTLLVFRMTKPAPMAAIDQLRKEVRDVLDSRGFTDVSAILLPEYLELSQAVRLPQGEKPCSALERSRS